MPDFAIPSDAVFGTLPRTSCCGDGTWREFTEEFSPLPRSKWLPCSNKHLVWHIFAQLDGMCTSNGVAQTIMTIRARQGQSNVVLSPENLYGQHSSWGTGSTLDENLKAAVEVGVCDRETVPQENWRPSSWPSNWKENASKYKITEWFDLNGNFDYLATALQMGFTCNIGLNWPGGGGHSVAVTDLIKESNQWKISGPNSWGKDWGDDGFYYLTEAQCQSSPRFGSFAARSVVIQG